MIYDKIDFFSPTNPALDQRLISYCETVTNAVGARVGPVHIEVMLTEDGPLLVEIAARAHGGIGTSVIDDNFSPSFIDAIINAYLPETISATSQFNIIQKKAASIAFLISDQAGTLVSLTGCPAPPETFFIHSNEAVCPTRGKNLPHDRFGNMPWPH